MNTEFMQFSPIQIEKMLDFNPKVRYKRKVLKITHTPPSTFPILFHSTNSANIDNVKPEFCQSFDYTFNGKPIPVSYALPKPHVNRVRNASEIWRDNKREAYDETGVLYSYVTIRDKNGIDKAQIRMASTMLDNKLLAVENSGFVFKVKVAEMNGNNVKKVLDEYISLADLPVIDSYQFTSPSPVGPGMGGIETHLPLDIPNPNFVGYHSIQEYLNQTKDSPDKRRVVDAANALLSQHSENTMPGVFEKLVEINREAVRNALLDKSR